MEYFPKSIFYILYIPFQSSGSQESNSSNGVQFGVETKELHPLKEDHSKLKANFAGLRNQPLAAKSAFGCEMISQPSCSSAKFRSHFVRLRNSPECFQIFATIVFCYFASDICCLNANSLLVIHQLDDSLVVEQGCRGKQPDMYCFVIFTLKRRGTFPRRPTYVNLTLSEIRSIFCFLFLSTILYFLSSQTSLEDEIPKDERLKPFSFLK